MKLRVFLLLMVGIVLFSINVCAQGGRVVNLNAVVDSTSIKNDSVGNEDLVPNSVTTTEIRGSTIDSTDVKDVSLSVGDVANGANGFVPKVSFDDSLVKYGIFYAAPDSTHNRNFGTPWDMATTQYVGDAAYGQAGEGLVFGDLIRQHTDGKYYKTDADSLITMDRYPRVALGTITANAYGWMFIRGYICNSSWTFSTIGTLFASTTTGTMTQTAPAGDEDRVQTVGKLENTDIIWFDPEHSWVEVEVP